MFCLSGVGKYDVASLNIPAVPTELTTMRRTLLSLGLTEHLPFDEDERSHDALDLGLTRGGPPGVSTLVIYCTGHGKLTSDSYQLLLPAGNWFNPAKLIEPLEEDGWESLNQVLIIVDACQAEPGVDAAWATARRSGGKASRFGFWGVGASRRLQDAQPGRFATAFAAAVDRAAQPSWTVSHLDPGAIAEAVDKALGPRQTVWLAEGHPAQPCQVLPNPRYQNPSLPTGLPLTTAWATAARGVASPDLPGFFFTGRGNVLGTLREHLTKDADEPVAVVLAQPGSGRSALLGHLVLTVDERGHRALPGETQLAWPPLPVTIATAQGDPSQAADMLRRQLAGSAEEGNLLEALQSAAKPVGIVLDDLDELAGQERWTQFFGTVLSVPGVRIAVGLPAGSAIRLPNSPRVHDLDEEGNSRSQEMWDYLHQQVQLAVPGAAAQEIRDAAGALAERVGTNFEVAVALTALGRTPQGGSSIKDYLIRATKTLDIAAHRVCRARLAIALGDKAEAVVSALSALCSYDQDTAIPAVEWAAAASRPGEPPVDVDEIATAARLMGALVQYRPTVDGVGRWRTRFGYPDAPGYLEPHVFLQRLPQVARWNSLDWAAVDPGVASLVTYAAALDIIPGRMLDDPGFLLGAPPTIVSKAIRAANSDPGERISRSRMWQAVPTNASAADRALLLRLGAQRFQVKPVVTAFEAACSTPGHSWQPACAIDWVQPDSAGYTRVLGMALTPGPAHTAAITIQDDDSLAFWDPSDGTPIRERVSVPGTFQSVTAAVVRGEAVALVSTWERGIWLVRCHENAPPTLIPQLVPPHVHDNALSRRVPLLVALHPGGQVVVGDGREVWLGNLGSSQAVQKLVTLESEALAIRTAGPDGAPVVWLVPESGRVRRVSLSKPSGSELVSFPLPQRPLATAVSETGDRMLIADVTGALHLRGASGAGGALSRATRSLDVRAVAIDASMAVVAGGSAGSPGWVDIHDLTGSAPPARVLLDEPVLDVALLGEGAMILSRPSGLLALNWNGHCLVRAAKRPERRHG